MLSRTWRLLPVETHRGEFRRFVQMPDAKSPMKRQPLGIGATKPGTNATLRQIVRRTRACVAQNRKKSARTGLRHNRLPTPRQDFSRRPAR